MAKKTKQPEPVGRRYGAARQALEAFACPTCGRKAGKGCKGQPSVAHPTGLEWQKSKVHAARSALWKET
jgi:hypothetical protein